MKNEDDILKSDDIIYLDKKQAYFKLYETLETVYKNYDNAFEVLNVGKVKDKIIDEIFSQCYYDKEIEIYLKQQYFKINNELNKEYKHRIIINTEEVKPKMQINWSYLFETILKILLFPIFICLGCTFTYDRQKRRSRRGY